MTHKTFRPAVQWDGEQAGTDYLAWQQSSVFDSKLPKFSQESLITSYQVDDRLNVICVQFGLRLREVHP